MKKILFICVIIFLIAYSFFYPEITINASRKGIEIWFHQILPALLPFTILSSVMVKSDFLRSFKGNANLIACLLTLYCGFVFGFPIGAKLSSDFHKQRLISEKQATILAIATNNFSPMYVCGFALPLLFASTEFNIVTYIILYLIPLVIATLYLLLDTHFHPYSTKDETLSNFQLNMSIIDSGILKGFEALIKICGYIVLFSIIASVFTNIFLQFQPQLPLLLTLLLGNLEITNGLNLLSTVEIGMSLKYIIAIQLLAFGGLSGIAQTGSILADAKLCLHKYIIGKVALSLLLTSLSVIYVFFIRLFEY